MRLPLKAFIQLDGYIISTSFMLKSDDFQLTDFSKISTVRMLFAHPWFVGFIVHELIAHARVLTGCTHDSIYVDGIDLGIQYHRCI